MKVFTLLISLLIVSSAFAQDDEVDKFYKAGIAYFDAGDYKRALSQYQNALNLDKENTTIMYEIALTYYSLQDFDKAVKWGDKAMDGKDPDTVIAAALLVGSVHDNAGQPKQSLKTYKKAKKIAPDYYLINYNIGLTLYGMGEFEEAEEVLHTAVQDRPTHGSSHLLLGFLMHDQQRRVESLMALYLFLLVEPESERTPLGYELLTEQLGQGIERTSRKAVTINISPAALEGEFGHVDLMLSLLGAGLDADEEGEEKTDAEKFAEITGLMFASIGETDKRSKNPWWNYYAQFYSDLHAAEHSDALAYFVSSHTGNAEVMRWLEQNGPQVQAMKAFFENYEFHR